MEHPREVINTTALGNGLRVVTEAIPGSRTAAFGVWVAVGSRDEAPEQSGASHFLEHLLFKGTETWSARQVAEIIDGVGGDMNAFTSREHTAFYARVPDTAADLASDVLFDVVRSPALRPTDVDAERLVIGEELTAAVTTPDDLVFMSLYDELFAGHALGREVLGEPATINAMTPADIADFHGGWYLPSNLVVAAAGQVVHEEIVEKATAVFGDLPRGHHPKRTSPEAVRQTTVANELPVEQAHIAIGWRGLPHGHEDRHALAIANQVLGASPSSRLFQTIREQRALAYTVFSTTSGYADAGSASVYAATAAPRAKDLRVALDDAIAELLDGGVTSQELDRARSGFEGSIVLGLEDSGSRMSRIANGIALRDTVMPIDEFLDRLNAVTIDDVNRVLNQVYGQPSVTSIVGPASALVAAGV
ncbi:MAG: insulinase family protein [Acidimicrobiales bacterium]|nr:insulinase family protein [Acidimicrobiales bacterium]RZV42918.1 MAG: insulinase family protein [Acidimicrobiales bacterium]